MQMKGVISLFFLICFANNLMAQIAQNKNLNHSSATANSKILANTKNDELLVKEIEYDFGKIPQGKPVTHIFEVVNGSNDSLKILNVQASCGCTTPDWEKNQVQAPNQKTFITVGYNAANEGDFEKTITITYNGDKTKQIFIKGNVWVVPLSSAPENKDLTNLKEEINTHTKNN